MCLGIFYHGCVVVEQRGELGRHVSLLVVAAVGYTQNGGEAVVARDNNKAGIVAAAKDVIG